jgi:hypothetical protein
MSYSCRDFRLESDRAKCKQPSTSISAELNFESCEVVGRITNKNGVANEETTAHPEILLC